MVKSPLKAVPGQMAKLPSPPQVPGRLTSSPCAPSKIMKHKARLLQLLQQAVDSQDWTLGSIQVLGNPLLALLDRLQRLPELGMPHHAGVQGHRHKNGPFNNVATHVKEQTPQMKGRG